MAEYIDREAVHQALNKAPTGYWGSEGHLVYADDAHKQIDAIPAANVREVKRGKWEKTVGENGVTSAYRCSICGFEDNRYALFNYCPNCGADMREQEAKEEPAPGPYDLLHEEGGWNLQ